MPSPMAKELPQLPRGRSPAFADYSELSPSPSAQHDLLPTAQEPSFLLDVPSRSPSDHEERSRSPSIIEVTTPTDPAYAPVPQVNAGDFDILAEEKVPYLERPVESAEPAISWAPKAISKKEKKGGKSTKATKKSPAIAQKWAAVGMCGFSSLRYPIGC